MKQNKTRNNTQALDKARVLELLASNPGANKRDLAKLLGLKGSDRITLKRVLKELEQDGAIEGTKKRGLTKRGELPDITVIEITGTDSDGEFLARPLQWDSNEEPPRIYVIPPKDGGAPSVGSQLLAKLEKTGEHYEARIIRKLEKDAPTRLLGVLRENRSSDSRSGGFRLESVDKKARTEYALEKTDLGGAKHNELVAVESVPGRIAGFSRVRVVERIGSMDSPRTISLIAIHDHGIPTEFPADVIAQAQAAQPVDPRGRTDLRDIPLLTIDPADARDHDDAVWAGPDDDPKNPGGQVCLVAIADVAYYVTPVSALDKEAWKRGNSAYFPDRVVPMLPEELSADLCSLKDGVDRACLVVRMVVDSKGRKRSHTFMRGVMRSAARLTYQQAQAAFDGRPDAAMSGTVKQALAQLWTAYQTLTIERAHRDPLDLDLPERRIVLGADGKVGSIAYRDRLESMKLIEEFMVLANVCAAESLEEKRQPLIYRVHDNPSKEKVFAFSDFLRTLNLNFAKGQLLKPGIFNRILDQGKGKPHEAVLNDVVLRSQAQAIYDDVNIGHFGLNLAKYAHFTSPIRRYADLIVHRALIRAFKFGDDGLSDGEAGKLKSTAEHITVTERRAMAAERDSTDRYVAAYMADRIGAEFTARVTGVTRFGLFVRLAETGAEGLIPVRSLGGEFFRHDERAQALIGERTKHAYRMGDAVSVTLQEAAPVTGGLRFGLAGVEAPPDRRNFRPGGPKRGGKPGKKSRFKAKKR